MSIQDGIRPSVYHTWDTWDFDGKTWDMSEYATQGILSVRCVHTGVMLSSGCGDNTGYGKMFYKVYTYSTVSKCCSVLN